MINDDPWLTLIYITPMRFNGEIVTESFKGINWQQMTRSFIGKGQRVIMFSFRWVRTQVAMATCSSNRIKMGKRKLTFFLSQWNSMYLDFYLQKCSFIF